MKEQLDVTESPWYYKFVLLGRDPPHVRGYQQVVPREVLLQLGFLALTLLGHRPGYCLYLCIIKCCRQCWDVVLLVIRHLLQCADDLPEPGDMLLDVPGMISKSFDLVGVCLCSQDVVVKFHKSVLFFLDVNNLARDCLDGVSALPSLGLHCIEIFLHVVHFSSIGFHSLICLADPESEVVFVPLEVLALLSLLCGGQRLLVTLACIQIKFFPLGKGYVDLDRVVVFSQSTWVVMKCSMYLGRVVVFSQLTWVVVKCSVYLGRVVVFSQLTWVVVKCSVYLGSVVMFSQLTWVVMKSSLYLGRVVVFSQLTWVVMKSSLYLGRVVVFLQLTWVVVSTLCAVAVVCLLHFVYVV
ncbi:hypothetical protein E2C01_024367 [Portunus trituberculatus]|uniref:Uncharacterized protein n=1 Tax=Portunus trituberculatus TaxID=210409 RepID=A0A5B7EA58_PORTR|nr:hypothetical protein [Portunus trituberculatus]